MIEQSATEYSYDAVRDDCHYSYHNRAKLQSIIFSQGLFHWNFSFPAVQLQDVVQQYLLFLMHITLSLGQKQGYPPVSLSSHFVNFSSSIFNICRPLYQFIHYTLQSNIRNFPYSLLIFLHHHPKKSSQIRKNYKSEHRTLFSQFVAIFPLKKKYEEISHSLMYWDYRLSFRSNS